MAPIDLFKARRIFLVVIAATTAVPVLILPFSKLSLDLRSFAPLLYVAGVLIAASLYCRITRMQHLAAALEAVGFGFFVTLPILVLTYLAVAADFPLADARLDAMDRALGFNWFAFIHFVDTRPVLARTLFIAYQTISFQLIVIPVALVALRKPVRAYAMMTGYATLCIFATAVAVFYPAIGPYPYFGITASDLANINPHFALTSVSDFTSGRNDPAITLALGKATGLLCYPSVHAGVAYLAAWAAWDAKWLRLPVLLLDIAMCISAISHGGHYLADVIAGLGVAALTTAAITALFYERPAWIRSLWPEREIPQPAE